MDWYVQNIIVPYVAATCIGFEEDTPAMVIMDNLKGQISSGVIELLEENSIHVVFLLPNTTASLQPMDLLVNKLAKDFLKTSFGSGIQGK